MSKDGYTKKQTALPFAGLTEHAKKNFDIDLANKATWTKDNKENEQPAQNRREGFNTGAQITMVDGMPIARRSQTVTVGPNGEKQVGVVEAFTGPKVEEFIVPPPQPMMRRRMPVRKAAAKGGEVISGASGNGAKSTTVSAAKGKENEGNTR